VRETGRLPSHLYVRRQTERCCAGARMLVLYDVKWTATLRVADEGRMG